MWWILTIVAVIIVIAVVRVGVRALFH